MLIISQTCSQVPGKLLAGMYCRWPHTCTSSGWMLEAACLLPASGAARHPTPVSWSPQAVIRTSLPYSLPRALSPCLSLHFDTWCESQGVPQPDSFLQLGPGSSLVPQPPSSRAVSPLCSSCPFAASHPHRGVVTHVAIDSGQWLSWTKGRHMKKSNNHNLFPSKILDFANCLENISLPML